MKDVDYLEAFNPTPTTASIRMLTIFACEHDSDVYHLDAEQPIVRLELDEEIFMMLPPGCRKLSGSAVLLNRSLYRLKQGGRY